MRGAEAQRDARQVGVHSVRFVAEAVNVIDGRIESARLSELAASLLPQLDGVGQSASSED